ncbi:hypothetical protein HK099_000852 [Clydaea vesicula]|uniref:Uncharacterized protein n=1 Tax=Clydaea vesicula TaxID=447962 RepID=A0AAD5U3Z0_9FUNG|nr:hypothetical protein HK099_000852 [Clydaea vesicula]KAJ3390898.1 hypothetical protein HDU92_000258 [Lobulomyces angularis]
MVEFNQKYQYKLVFFHLLQLVLSILSTVLTFVYLIKDPWNKEKVVSFLAISTSVLMAVVFSNEWFLLIQRKFGGRFRTSFFFFLQLVMLILWLACLFNLVNAVRIDYQYDLCITDNIKSYRALEIRYDCNALIVLTSIVALVILTTIFSTVWSYKKVRVHVYGNNELTTKV